jgi:hypothetical protein
MWVVYCFVAYLALALIIPAGWALVPVWLRTRRSRHVYCPAASHTAMVALDPWYAVRMHSLGNPELYVKACSQWPQRRNCGQACLARIGAAVEHSPAITAATQS